MYTASCDIFSWGCILFETIFGGSPFENEDGSSVFESNEKTRNLDYEIPPEDDELKYSPEYKDLLEKVLTQPQVR